MSTAQGIEKLERHVRRHCFTPRMIAVVYNQVWSLLFRPYWVQLKPYKVERARTARQRAAGATATALTAGEQARAREDLELCTGVSLEDIERRLEAARARAHVRGWDWADGLD